MLKRLEIYKVSFLQAFYAAKQIGKLHIVILCRECSQSFPRCKSKPCNVNYIFNQVLTFQVYHPVMDKAEHCRDSEHCKFFHNYALEEH